MYEGVDADLPDRVSWAEGFYFPLLVVRCVGGKPSRGLTCPLPSSRAVDVLPHSSRTSSLMSTYVLPTIFWIL